jgi:hypothetical protein
VKKKTISFLISGSLGNPSGNRERDFFFQLHNIDNEQNIHFVLSISIFEEKKFDTYLHIK